METNQVPQQIGVACLCFIDLVLENAVKCLMMNAQRDEEQHWYPIEHIIPIADGCVEAQLKIVGQICALIPWQSEMAHQTQFELDLWWICSFVHIIDRSEIVFVVEVSLSHVAVGYREHRCDYHAAGGS